MKIRNDQRGIAHVAILVLVVVFIGVVGFIGWKVWDNGQKKDQKTTTVSSTELSSTKANGNKYFTIDLPAQWRLTDEKPQNVAYYDAFTYSDNSGKKLVVYVNIGNVGGAGDASIEYQVAANKITLPIADVKLGECVSDDYLCSIGDGKLRVMSSSAETIKSNNYLFDYQDDKTESTSSLSTMKSLIESMRF